MSTDFADEELLALVQLSTTSNDLPQFALPSPAATRIPMGRSPLDEAHTNIMADLKRLVAELEDDRWQFETKPEMIIF
ncbi:hypothetical protein H4R33_002173 [Dimargaris cristalligena]|nr:hypothetical protein H4R33_002173 [Dimargaris cristalligena]